MDNLIIIYECSCHKILSCLFYGVQKSCDLDCDAYSDTVDCFPKRKFAEGKAEKIVVRTCRDKKIENKKLKEDWINLKKRKK